jgi:tyrosyl-tRNA synthetase
LVQGGGIYIDNERVAEPTTPVTSTKLIEKGFIVLRSGKKNYHIVKLAE